jgi:hypothetical protein
VTGLDLAELVNRKVHHELAQANGRIDELVRQALEDEIGRRVHEAVKLELGVRAASISEAEGKRCSRCRQIKPVDAYEKHRSVCRHCRRDAARESKQRRPQEPDPEEGHSPASAT